MPRPKPIVPWHTNPLTIRMTWEQRMKLKKLGGAEWLRQQIEIAPLTKEIK